MTYAKDFLSLQSELLSFLKTLPYIPENKIILLKLSKSAASSGSSKADFSNKVWILIRGNEGIKSLAPSSKNLDNQTLQSWFLLLSFYFLLLFPRTDGAKACPEIRYRLNSY